MKKKVLFVCLAFFALRFDLSATTVKQVDAQNVALNFFTITLGANQPRTPLSANLVYTKTESDGIVDFYVYDMSPTTGFVIVGADDNDEPIIGYSTESSFHTNFSNIGMANWLNRWSEELHYVALNNYVASPSASTRWSAYKQGISIGSAKSGSVSPLLKQIAWSQSSSYGPGYVLYNNYCPVNGGSYCVTGCVATAMAQIMKYWNYPTTGISSSSYSDTQNNGFTDNNGTLSFNYANTTFDWTHMPNGLDNTSSSTQINAIGTLMYACGVSVEMDYDPNGSGAFVLSQQAGPRANAQTSYVKYFGYQSSTISGLLLSSTTNSNFISNVEADLTAGRPVQMQGTDVSFGGHSWVCDGYQIVQGVDMLHMNWGWDGYSNNYFALTNMDPNDGSGIITFSTDVGVLMGIQPPSPALTVHAAAASSSICPNASTGLTASGPVSANYSWSPSTGLSCTSCSNPTATIASTTTYTVTADSAGITATASVTVNVNAAIIPGSGSGSKLKCYGDASGAASITATGGSGGFSYHWNNGQTTATINNLTAGTYTVTITDVKGCTVTTSETVSQPTQLTGTIVPINPSCGASNGSAAVTASGGTSSYSYHWGGGQTSASISNLGAGTYSVTVTDSKTCTASASTTIISSGGLTPSISSSNISCYGAATGSVTASVTGSTGNVTYAWSNGGSSSTISNVTAGNYTVTITDGAGCATTASKTVSQPASGVTVSLTPSNASCNHSNGSVSAAVSGGLSGYSYNWSTGATSVGISGLGAGTYQVTVHDANSCSTSAAVTLTSSSGLNTSASATATSCYGTSNGSISLTVNGASGNITYAWSNGGNTAVINNLAPGSYTVTVTDGSGCAATISGTVSQPSALSVTLLPSGASCGAPNGSVTAAVTGGNSGGYTYSWSNGGSGASIGSLSAGTYVVTVNDSRSCSATAAGVVTSAGSLALNPTVNNISCYGETNGSAIIGASNGTGPYTFAWSNGNNVQTGTNLTAGLYIITVTDAHSCSSSVSINITQPAQMVATTSTIACSNGQSNGSAAVTNVTGGNGTYSYLWSNGESTQSINNVPAGMYQVSVSDIKNCQTVAQAVVSGATGITDLNGAISFSIYPNPASTEIVISASKLSSTEATVSIQNILGQQLLIKPVTDTQTHIDVSTLANGVYLVKLRQGELVGIKQLIVNK